MNAASKGSYTCEGRGNTSIRPSECLFINLEHISSIEISLYFSREMYGAKTFYTSIIKSPSTSKKRILKTIMVTAPGTAVFVWDHTAPQLCLTEPEVSRCDLNVCFATGGMFL